MTAPTCFISYSWDSDAHRDWVRYLADALCNNGVDTRLDQYDVFPGMDLTTYMETCVRESNYVLLICTPTFAQKANLGKGGVGYEKAIVTGQIFHDSTSRKKFLPLLRSGRAEDALPAYLASRVFIDFREDNKFQVSLEQLLRHMFESPLYTRPPLGQRPRLTGPVVPTLSPSVVVPRDPSIQTWPPTVIGKDGRERLLIRAGEFVMGSKEEQPLHKVYLDAFYIDRYPVTNADFKRFVDATMYQRIPYHWKDGQIPVGKQNHPVVNITWYDAVAYAEWACARLPTEAEWEKAASWDDLKKEKRRYPWGNKFDKDKCNTSESGIGDTTPVGTYPSGASPYGVLDMAGNAYEWVADSFSNTYYSSSPKNNPKGPDSEDVRVLRGASCYDYSGAAQCARRMPNPPDYEVCSHGFRVAQSFPWS